MNERDYESLIQEVLDGTATPQEVEKLEAWLAHNELGRTRRRELESVFQALGRVRPAEAPAELKQAVLSTLEARAAGGTVRGGARGSHGWFGPRTRLAYVFAAGLAAGAVSVGALTGVLPPVGPEGETSGTMMPSTAPAAEALRRSWKAGDARIEAITWRAGKARLVSVQIRGEGAAEVELTFDSSELTAGSVRQAGASAAVEVEPGTVKVRGENRGEYTIEFPEAGASAPIQIAVRSGGATTLGELPAP